MSKINMLTVSAKILSEIKTMSAFTIDADDKTKFLESKIAFVPVLEEWPTFVSRSGHKYDIFIYAASENCVDVNKSFKGYDESTNSVVDITLDNAASLKRIVAEGEDISAEDIAYIKKAFDNNEFFTGTIAALRLERDMSSSKDYKIEFDDSDKIAMICFQVLSEDEKFFHHDVELLVDFVTSTNCTIDEIEPFLASRNSANDTEQ